jgi:DNA polymerase-3 subunit epsilon
MAAALFAGCDDVVRDGDGRWRLVEYRPSAAPTMVSDVGMRGDLLRDLSYVVVDVETTGSSPWSGDRVTEVAAVVVRAGEIVEVYETLVNPERPIPPMITALTNISWEMVKNAPRFADVAPALSEVLRGHVFVAHNALFDWRFLAAEYARATGERLEGRRLCTVRLARRLLPQLPRRSLDFVARHYDVDISARHRAAGDAVATAHVLLGLLRDAMSRDLTTWDALDGWLRTPQRSPRRRRAALPRPVDRDTSA